MKITIDNLDKTYIWDFLELIRLKRNAINYRGQLLKYDDWKMLKLKFELHINALKKKIENKLNEKEQINPNNI